MVLCPIYEHTLKPSIAKDLLQCIRMVIISPILMVKILRDTSAILPILVVLEVVLSRLLGD
jgi:hypothetical protein